MSSRNIYNDVCSLYRKLYPDKTGNKADEEVKEKYWKPYKAGNLDIQKVIDELKGTRDP